MLCMLTEAREQRQSSTLSSKTQDAQVPCCFMLRVLDQLNSGMESGSLDLGMNKRNNFTNLKHVLNVVNSGLLLYIFSFSLFKLKLTKG